MENKSKYRLIVSAGVYEADNLLRLIFMVLSHRFHHLLHDGKWID